MNMSIESRSPLAASEPSTASGSGAAAGDPLDREDGVGSLSRRDIPDDNYSRDSEGDSKYDLY